MGDGKGEALRRHKGNTSSIEAKGRDKMQGKGVGCFCVQLRPKKINTEKRPWNPVTLVLPERAVSTE